jgi:hypothetical protein
MAISFDKTVDYAQKYIDLARAGAPDYKLVEVLAQREAKQEAGHGSQYMDNASFLGVVGQVVNRGASNSNIQGGVTQPTVAVKEQDENGIAQVAVAGYDPTDYAVSYKTTSSTSSGISNILGYVVIGLIGIALLDRFMNSSGKK